MPDPKWKAFEKDVHAIHAQFASPNSSVFFDVKLLGSESGVMRQLDVAIEAEISNYKLLVAVECKDQRRPVDVETLSSFAMKVRDVRANKGVMISTSGYSEAAINLARTQGLDTLDFGTSTAQLEGLATICVTSTRKDVNWRVLGRLLDYEIRKAPLLLGHHSELFNADGSPAGKISHVVESRMAAGLVPGDDGKQVIDFGQVYLTVDGELLAAHILAEVFVKTSYYLGYFQLERTQMKDVQTGQLVRDLIRTPHISTKPWEIPQPEWRQVTSLTELATVPAFELRDGPAWAFKSSNNK